MKTIAYTLLFTCFFSFRALSQAPPSCNSSDLRYTNVLNDATGATLFFALSPPQPMVQSYFLAYSFNIDTGPVADSLPVPVPGSPQSLAGIPNNHLHAFTARNICTDGSVHTGATFFLDFRNAHEDCPAIRDFQLLDLNPNFIAFAWGPDPQVDSFRVSYQAGALPQQDNFTPEPFWEQALFPATVHTFSIAALCTTPGLAEQAVVEGPEFRFSIIIIDDIKAIATPWDTIQDALCQGYRIQCSHGDYGTNKELFISDHPPLSGMAGSCPVVVPVRDPRDLAVGLVIAPNPVSGAEAWCSFALRGAAPVWIDILDYSGRLHRRLPVRLSEGAHRIPLPTGSLPPGLYVVRLQNGGRVFSSKFVKL